MKQYLFAVAILSGLAVNAQELRSETQAIRCGAISFIHTSMSASNPAFGEAMTQSGIFYGGFFGVSRKNRTGLTTTNGEVNARRELVLEELKKTWVSNPEVVVRETALCNTWRGQFGPQLAALKDDGNDAELVRIVGEPPVRPSKEEIERWRPIVPVAFAAWAALDYGTPASVRRKLVESMKKP
jgi:hypothetical protein